MPDRQARKSKEKQVIPAIVTQCLAAWDQQRKLCDALELIADSLPDSVDRQACIHTARALPNIIMRAHELEESQFFSALESVEIGNFNPRPTLERLRIEHAGDVCFAEEVCDVLMSYGTVMQRHDPEAMGYLLRGFIVGVRRHIAIEEELAALLTVNPPAARHN